MGALAGRTVVVTRSAEQAGRLSDLLRAEGATVLEVPVTRTAEPADGGVALRAAAARLDRYRWVILTSPNGAAALRAAARGGVPPAVPVAVVGPGTADAVAAAGGTVALVPERFVAEGLLEVFPDPPAGGGRVLVAQAEAARPVLAEGLRRRGWQVDEVVAYRTVPAAPPRPLLEAASRADAVTFAAGSAVAAYLDAAGPRALPPVVVCIGPVTAAAAEARGIAVTRVAGSHDLPGLVAAVAAALGVPLPPGSHERSWRGGPGTGS